MKAAPIESDDYSNIKNVSTKDDVRYGVDIPSSPHFDPGFYQQWFDKEKSALLYLVMEDSPKQETSLPKNNGKTEK